MASYTVTSKDREEKKKNLVSEEPVSLGSTYYKNGESPQSAFQNYYNDVTGGGQYYKQIYDDGSKEYVYEPNIPQGIDKNGDGGLTVSYGPNGKLVNTELQDHNAVWTYGGKVYDNKIGSNGKVSASKIFDSMKNLPTYTGIDKDINPTYYWYGEGANAKNPNQLVWDNGNGLNNLSGMQVDAGTLGYVPNGSYNDRGMSAEDEALIKQLQVAYQSAMASGDASAAQGFHDRAEAIRKLYGYSGGVDGSEYIPIELLNGYTANNGNLLGNISGSVNGSINGGYGGYGDYNGDEFDSRYDPIIQELLNAVLSQEDFSYNPEEDVNFQQIRAGLLREGVRSMNDVLASAASGAGGMNSFAITSAQQALNNANAEIGNIIPELWQLAYQMHNDKFDRAVQNLELVLGLDNNDYERFFDERNFDYNAWRDSVADSQYEQEYGMAVKSSAYDIAMDYIKMGVVPSTTILNQAGIDLAEAQSMVNSVLGKTSTAKSDSNPSPKPKDDPKPKEDDGYSSLPDYAKGLYTDIMKKGYSPTEIDEKLTAEVDKGYITLAQAKILADILIG